jgi:hypothetical protein
VSSALGNSLHPRISSLASKPTPSYTLSLSVLSRGYSPELETTGSLPKIEISRISHGSDLR